MKRFCYLLATMMAFVPLTGRTAETANGRIYCYSLRFQRGIDPNGNYYLDLTSVNGTVNGELALDFFNSGYTHSSYLSLIDELLGDTLSGEMAVDVPDGGDANGNGFPDFFEVSQGLTNLTSSGGFNLPVYGNGTVTATWNRNAGSKDGSCVLRMKLMPRALGIHGTGALCRGRDEGFRKPAPGPDRESNKLDGRTDAVG
jgi:hypothetical protein